jgi:hypothetical protein
MFRELGLKQKYAIQYPIFDYGELQFDLDYTVR